MKGSARRPAAPLPRRVYALLAQGRLRTGPQLAAACGVSRSAIWKAMSILRTLGVSVHAVANRGYRLPHASALLDPARIRAHLSSPCAARVRQMQTLWNTGSTNADLLQRSAPSPGQLDVLSAEYQSAGRGRRTRHWFAPPGGALCLSLGWSFAAMPADIGALSLAVGVCVLRALADCAVSGVNLKWPNDLLAGQAKLGGILIELRAEAGGPVYVVVGIGLNVALGDLVSAQVAATGTRATDLVRLTGVGCDRNRLAAALIERCVAGLLQFERAGFAAFAQEWRAADALAGKSVRLTSERGSVIGHARGIDIDGALCLQTRDGLQRFVTGEVSVRVVP